jgi:preprotein translocase subunit SecE
MGWSIYRPGEGRITRYGALVIAIGMGAFSAYRWWLWGSPRVMLPFVGRLPLVGGHQLNWGEVGATVILVAFVLGGYGLAFVRPGTSDFLIETEIELRKVTWPEWKPLFRSTTELWGSTYVVIMVVAALVFFIFAVDRGLIAAANAIFFR